MCIIHFLRSHDAHNCPKCRKYRVIELTQTFHDHRINTCSFMFRGKYYKGEGRSLHGIQRTLSQKGYMWTIYTHDHNRLFTFATHDANERISIMKLSKWMREYLDQKKPAG